MMLLIALATLGGASMHVLMPWLPTLEHVFGTDYHAVQGTLTLFLAGAALAQLTVGAISDAWGRQAPLLLALGIFSIGSAVAALAPSLGLVDLGRFLQGFGGAGCLVLAEAIVATSSTPTNLARRIGYLNVGMAVAIMIAPLTGAGLGWAFGWRGIFRVLLAAGTLLLAVVWFRHPEEAAPPIRAASVSAHLGLANLLGSREFVSQTLCASFVMANYFVLAAVGPYFAMAVLGLDQIEYGFVFGTIGIGYVIGSLASGTMSERYGQERMAIVALSVGTLAGGAGVALLQLGWMDLWSFLAVTTVVALAAGLVLPAATSRALRAEPGSVGAAAGLFNFALFGIGAIVSELAGSQLNFSAPLAVGAMPVVTMLALVFGLLAVRRAAHS
jgi:MFS transporter, DHA1 family, multidrug resistance protein